MINPKRKAIAEARLAPLTPSDGTGPSPKINTDVQLLLPVALGKTTEVSHLTNIDAQYGSSSAPVNWNALSFSMDENDLTSKDIAKLAFEQMRLTRTEHLKISGNSFSSDIIKESDSKFYYFF